MCGWCGDIGHIEHKCYDKTNVAARGVKANALATRGRGSGGRGRGQGGFGKFEEGGGKFKAIFSEVIIRIFSESGFIG